MASQPFRFHETGWAAYRRLSRFAPGRSITSGRLAGGPLKRAGDVTLRRGPASVPLEQHGVALAYVPLERLTASGARPRSTWRARGSAL